MEKLKYFMNRLGYTDEEIIKIRNSQSLKGVKEETLIGNIYNVFMYLISLKFSIDEIKIIVKKYNGILNSSKNKIELAINYFKKLGINDIQLKNIILTHPQILSLNIVNIDSRINELYTIGFTRNQVLSIIIRKPHMFGFSTENIITTIEILSNGGFTLDEIIYIIYKYPAIFTQDNEKLSKKVKLYNSLGFKLFISLNPLNFMQSINLSYARYKFLKSNNFKIKDKTIFLSSEQFKNKYGISSEALINMYSLDNSEGLKRKCD